MVGFRLPSPKAKEPAGAFTQADWPLLPLNLPAGHGVQALEAVWGAKVPLGQAMQLAAPAFSEYLPALHSVKHQDEISQSLGTAG